MSGDIANLNALSVGRRQRSGAGGLLLEEIRAAFALAGRGRRGSPPTQRAPGTSQQRRRRDSAIAAGGHRRSDAAERLYRQRAPQPRDARVSRSRTASFMAPNFSRASADRARRFRHAFGLCRGDAGQRARPPAAGDDPLRPAGRAVRAGALYRRKPRARAPAVRGLRSGRGIAERRAAPPRSRSTPTRPSATPRA